MPPKTRKRQVVDADDTENVPPEHKKKKANINKALKKTKNEEFSGEIEPDMKFPQGNCHVYIDEDGTIYDATLNQTNLGNNNNKVNFRKTNFS